VEKTLTPPRAASHPAGTPVTSPEVTLSPARPVRCSSLTTRHLRVTQPVTLPRSARPPCKSAQGRMCQTLSPDPAPLHEWTVSRHGRTGTCAHLCQVSPGATHSPPPMPGDALSPQTPGSNGAAQTGHFPPRGPGQGRGSQRCSREVLESWAADSARPEPNLRYVCLSVLKGGGRPLPLSTKAGGQQCWAGGRGGGAQGTPDSLGLPRRVASVSPLPGGSWPSRGHALPPCDVSIQASGYRHGCPCTKPGLDLAEPWPEG
jgi:hypothetical protein